MNTRDKVGPLAIFRREISLLNSLPLLWVSFIVISLVPTFYALTYLGSLWDPYKNLGNLPAGLVNLDTGTEFNGESYNLGHLFIEELKKKQTFGFISFDQKQNAEDAVNNGDIYFALVIPADFSSKAIPGNETGELELITSSGRSYTASLIAQKFTEIAVENLNHKLELERWKVVLDSGATALNAARMLEDGAKKSLEGSLDLSKGIQRVKSGIDELQTGQVSLADGLGSIDTEKLVTAGQTLHAGTEKLASGLAEHKMIDKLAGIDPDQLGQLADGAKLYQDKIEELVTGLNKAADGAQELQQGGARLAEGAVSLQAGGRSLASGLQKLHAGLEQFAAAFPDSNKNADSLSVSVKAKHTEMQAVETNGQGFSPFLMAFSLWIGAMSASFVFLATTFSNRHVNASSSSRVLGKEITPALMCVAGTIILGVAIQMMGTPVHNLGGYYVILILAALTYNAIIHLFMRLLGDSGKLVALLLLVVQLATASGAYPIELSSPFYQALSPYMPMTAVVDGLRAAMFGSFSANWGLFALKLLPWLLGSLVLSHLAIRRSTFVPDEDYGPALKLAFGKNR